MAMRLPGGIRNERELYDFLFNKGDARTIVPEDRYNTEGYVFSNPSSNSSSQIT
jgi:acyl transferase domain-containing protein